MGSNIIGMDENGTIEKELDDEDLLYNAMKEAYNAFNKYFEDQCLDGAYWSLYLTGYCLDSSFEKMKEIRLNLNCVGKDEFQYPDKEEDDKNEVI